ncbi:glycosyltransferase family 4 protein [Modestobacter lacusdianchii]
MAVSQAATDVVPEPVRITALHQRLAAAGQVLGITVEADDPTTGASLLYGRLVEHVHADEGTDGLWLLLTALSAAMPDGDELVAARRARDLHRSGDFGIWLLEATAAAAVSRGALDAEMDVVSDAVVVDVDFSARHRLHTGIQRVVRETVPRWAAEHELTLVAWTDQSGATRHLLDDEADRVLRWHDLEDPGEDDGLQERQHRLVVPWRSNVLLPENPPPEHCAVLAAMAVYSGNEVGLIGHDCIPVISPELIHAGLPDRFTRYLETVKHAHRVVGVSASAAREFRGFTQMLGAQGLTGPEIAVCPLPVETPPGQAVPRQSPPLVVSIGSFEPRKNQLAVLHAAEHLWREGLEFSLMFIGGGGWVTEADSFFSRLKNAGRRVERATAISDSELWRALRSARFSMFTSLHEGFGLPVAESLACGTPVLTSAYGSMAETAAAGGAVTVDPTDDLAIAAEMRRLLTDDALIDELRRAAAARPPRTWDDYARQSWDALVPSPQTTAEVQA